MAMNDAVVVPVSSDFDSVVDQTRVVVAAAVAQLARIAVAAAAGALASVCHVGHALDHRVPCQTTVSISQLSSPSPDWVRWHPILTGCCFHSSDRNSFLNWVNAIKKVQMVRRYIAC